MSEIKINNTNGTATVSSLQIARDFDKQHKDVLKSIKNIKAQISALMTDSTTSAQIFANLFFENTYTDTYGRKQKCYELTRDGFSLLVMSFDGSKALEWKLKYIDAFNLMEKELQDKNTQYRIKCRNFILINGITSFVGTVNDTEYLIDQTGNRRFVTVPLAPDLVIDYETQIKPFDALQLWAQVYHIVNSQEKEVSSCFRLTENEKQYLERRNSAFTKPMKGECEVLDILAEQQTPENGYIFFIVDTNFLHDYIDFWLYTAIL